jgi:hypothetical protein
MKNTNLTVILGVVFTAILAGCASTPTTLPRVGPEAANGSSSIGEGRIVVKTATEEHPYGDETYYYTHTGYRIYTEDGKLWNYIPNSSTTTEQSPTLVSIPAGDYEIHALSDFGSVIVPVRIRAGRTTEVNLEATLDNQEKDTNDTTVVSLPQHPANAYYMVGRRVPQNM